MVWKKAIFFVAVTGWTLALAVHLTAAIGHYDLSEAFPGIFVLHLGIFVVWLPTLFDLYRREALLHARKPRRFPLTLVIQNTPKWLIAAMVMCIVYAVVNWVWSMGSMQVGAHFENGVYSIQHHGQIMRVITEAEYHEAQANATRGISGHWLLFYGLAATIMYPFGKGKATA